jgi:tetratricopeptide (TPR) repeat protein
MNRFRFLILLLTLSFGVAYGAGSSTKEAPDGGGKPEEAFRAFNEGVRHRNKGWEYEQKAKGVEEKDKKAYERIVTSEYGKARDSFKKAIKLDESMHQAHGSLGYALRKLGDYEGALKAYASSLELKPDYGLAIEYRGEAYLDLDRVDDAQKAYERLVELKSRYAPVLLKAVAAWGADRRERREVPTEVLTKTDAWLDGHRSDMEEAKSKEELW